MRCLRAPESVDKYVALSPSSVHHASDGEVAGALGKFHGTASHRIGRPTRAASQWRDRPRP